MNKRQRMIEKSNRRSKVIKYQITAYASIVQSEHHILSLFYIDSTTLLHNIKYDNFRIKY